MVEFALPQVALREIDPDHLKDVDDNPEAVQFAVRLTEKPSEIWVTEFTQLYQQTPYLLKPPVTVEDDRVIVTYLPRYAGELPAFFNFLALIVRRGNEETRRSEELHTSDIRERRKIEFREALRRIELPK